jgi:hypothetical protein
VPPKINGNWFQTDSVDEAERMVAEHAQNAAQLTRSVIVINMPSACRRCVSAA